MSTNTRPDPENPEIPNGPDPSEASSQDPCSLVSDAPSIPTDSQAASQSEAAGTSPALSVEQLKEIVVALTDNLEQLKGDNLRLLADMDNLRKRTEREKEETAKYAITRFARDLVSVADNFQRAMSAVPQGAAEADPALAALVEGVSMTERELLSVLDRHGVTRIDPQGEAFNPHQHQAMLEQQDDTVAPGTILQVFQAGYLLEDRVLRPAMVIVAKGGRKPNPAEGNGIPDPA